MIHIILIGFKSAGKTFVGKNLAMKMKLAFIDLDKNIEKYYQKIYRNRGTCRQIMRLHGETFFRKLEHAALEKTLKRPKTAIIALGGGTPLKKENQVLLQQHCIIHIAAPKNVIFQRIKKNGRPAFFPQKEPLYKAFQRLWKKRIPVYKKIANLTIKNI